MIWIFQFIILKISQYNSQRIIWDTRRNTDTTWNLNEGMDILIQFLNIQKETIKTEYSFQTSTSILHTYYVQRHWHRISFHFCYTTVPIAYAYFRRAVDGNS